MKKKILIMTVFVTIFVAFLNVYSKPVYAAENTSQVPESHLLEIKEQQAKSIEEYKQKYGNDAYGITAYILHVVQIYSIPFCFLGIVIASIYRLVIGVRHLENAEKGLGMIVAIVTLAIICQVLPLVFAVVVKLGKE